MNSYDRPFLIRAHHLDTLAELLEEQDNLSGFLTDFIARILMSETILNPNGLLYKDDVVGEKGKQIGKFRQGVTRYVNGFLSLAETNPVFIGPFLDGICLSCAKGEHCRNDLRNFDRVAGEDLATAKFVTVARNFGYENIHSSESVPPSNGTIVLTDKVTVHGVLTRASRSGIEFSYQPR